jgi:hypothetical protein
MKHHATSMLRGLCILLLTAAAALPAAARSTTGYASFHVQNASQNYYGCLKENFGAVWNNCTTPVSLVFDMPITNTGVHSVTINGYWNLPSGYSFNCESYAYDGHGPYVVGDSGPATIFFAGQTVTEYVNVPSNGDVMQLICWNVPPGAGIASVNWSD